MRGQWGWCQPMETLGSSIPFILPQCPSTSLVPQRYWGVWVQGARCCWCLRGLGIRGLDRSPRCIRTQVGFPGLHPAPLSLSHSWIRPGRAAGQHVLTDSHVPSVREQRVTTPHTVSSTASRPSRWLEVLQETATAKQSVGMRSENRWGRDARRATGSSEPLVGPERRAWPGHLRRRRSSRAGSGPWHNVASRWVPPSVRGSWIRRQPERFILLSSCQAAGAVLQLRHPLGLLLVTLPAPQLQLGPTRLGLRCFAAPQVRLWAARGVPGAALQRFLGLSQLVSPPRPVRVPPAPCCRHGRWSQSMGALITLGPEDGAEGGCCWGEGCQQGVGGCWVVWEDPLHNGGAGWGADIGVPWGT